LTKLIEVQVDKVDKLNQKIKILDKKVLENQITLNSKVDNSDLADLRNLVLFLPKYEDVDEIK
jgi:hypothetical protein